MKNLANIFILLPNFYMNIYEIRSALNAAGSHFFDKQTLRFFGETMKSFGVRSIE